MINTEYNKYVISRNPLQTSNKRTTTGSHHLDILRTFYYQAVLNFLIPEENDIQKSEALEQKSHKRAYVKDDKCEKMAIKEHSLAKETFWCSEYHKCHALVGDCNILCVLYNSSVPTHAMRIITQSTLKVLTSEKQFCW